MKANCILGSVQKVITTRGRDVIYYSIKYLSGHICSTMSVSGPHNSKKGNRLERVKEMIKGLQNLPCEERLNEESETFQWRLYHSFPDLKGMKTTETLFLLIYSIHNIESNHILFFSSPPTLFFQIFFSGMFASWSVLCLRLHLKDSYSCCDVL